MAQGDLFKALKKSLDIIKKRDLRAEMAVFPHELIISAKQIEKETFLQIANIKLARTGTVRTKTTGALAQQPVRVLYGLGAGLTAEQSQAQLETLSQGADLTENQKRRISELCKEFAQNCYIYAKQAAGSNFHVEIISGGGTEYTLRVNQLTKPSPKNNAYEFIRDKILVPAKGTLMNQLNTLLKLNLQRKGPGAERFFNVGHVQAVSEVTAGLAIQTLQSEIRNIEIKRQVGNIAQEFLRFDLTSKFTALGNPEFTKEFEHRVAYVKPQSEVGNATQSDYEGALLNQVRQAIEKVIKENPSWAEQESSDSLITVIAKDLMATAKKHGAKVSGNTTKNTKSNKASAEIKKPVKSIGVAAKIGPMLGPGEQQDSGAGISLRSLIPMLNQRLPEIVRSNMGQSGRLVNRTGRFAESTEIVDIGDNAVISYSYMRRPYEVFEGHPSRDPRPLIEMSIRELAAGLVEQRFNMRRV